jgi:RNA polymerase sporulation-specific sigma factor
MAKQGSLEELDELEIVQQIKNNDSSNFEILFKRYIPVIKKLRTRYSIRNLEWDDWLQEGRIVFFNSVVNFDENLKITLGAFFRTNFTNRIYSILRFEMAYKRKAGLTAQSIESVDGDLETATKKISKITLHSNLVIKESYAEYESLLSKFEKEVSVLLFKGNCPEEIAEKLGYEVIKIQNAIVRCKQKLSEQMYGRP